MDETNIVGPDYADPPRNSPQMILVALALSALLWVPIILMLRSLFR